MSAERLPPLSPEYKEKIEDIWTKFTRASAPGWIRSIIANLPPEEVRALFEKALADLKTADALGTIAEEERRLDLD